MRFVTLLHNRRKFFDIASHNMLLTDYPRSKIEWVLVDDSDDVNDSPSDKVIKFQNENPDFGKIIYVPLGNKVSIGAKRNLGVSMANNDIILMMDDDDHYPKSSIEARVTYLRDLKKGCVYCSTLPMYDCQRYISAMNVPPMDLSPAERVSEATLAFTRQFWETKGFPADSNMAEGELFVTGRDSETAEIPPDGIIVSFLHGGNSTSRRVPERQEPNGCHYGFDDDFFTYLSERGMD
jgi:glycosyltransferase involved in cell wall biosynthesis